MSNGQDIFVQALRGEAAGVIPFLPLVNRLAAKLAGCSLQEMQADAGLWTGGMSAVAKLLDPAALAVAYDPTVTAEGLGAPIIWKNDSPRIAGPAEVVVENPETNGRQGVALEVMRRLFATPGGRACVAVLTGPVTSAAMLFGPAKAMDGVRNVKASLVRCMEAACETRPDLLLLMEGAGFMAGGVTPAHRRVYSTMKNIASYYNIPVGLFLRGYGDEDLSQLKALDLDCLALGSSASGRFPDPNEAWELAAGGVPFSLPGEDLEQASEYLRGATELARSRGTGFIAVIAEPDRAEFDMDKLRVVLDEIARTRI